MTARALLGPLGISLAAAIVCVIAVLTQIPPLVSAVVQRTTTAQDSEIEVASLVQRHEQESDLYTDRFSGRSAFFIPDPPPAQPLPRNDGEYREEQRDAGVAPYAGPKFNGLLGLDALFQAAGGRDTIKIGRGETVQGVTLLEILGPNTVKVRWKAPDTATARYEAGEYELKSWQPTMFGPGSPVSTSRPTLRAPRGISEAGTPPIPSDEEIDPDEIDDEPVYDDEVSEDEVMDDEEVIDEDDVVDQEMPADDDGGPEDEVIDEDEVVEDDGGVDDAGVGRAMPASSHRSRGPESQAGKARPTEGGDIGEEESEDETDDE